MTTYLDLLAMACVALFAFAIWPPAALLPVAGTALFISWSQSR